MTRFEAFLSQPVPGFNRCFARLDFAAENFIAGWVGRAWVENNKYGREGGTDNPPTPHSTNVYPPSTPRTRPTTHLTDLLAWQADKCKRPGG